MLCICASHSPLMLTGIADSQPGRQQRFFDTVAACRARIEAFDPELVVVFGPDHFNGLFLDLMPAFCIPTAASSTRDWGLPAGDLDIPRDIALGAIHACREAGLDVAVSHRMKVDHGTTIPLHKFTGSLARYPVLPVVIDCAAAPRPSFARIRRLGEVMGRYLSTLDKRVLLLGSGGLSHDPPTPRIEEVPPEVAARLIDRHTPSEAELQKREARVVAAAEALVRGEGPCKPPSEPWDRAFMDALLRQDTAKLDAYTDDELDRVAGFGSHEVRCWIAAFAAMHAAGNAGAGRVTQKLEYYEAIPEWVTGMGVVSAEHAREAATT